MANSKLIIIEGPQGVGKTTITNYIRDRLPYTNLYRLCGTSDTTKSGKDKAKNMYLHLNKYIKGLENTSINLLFDRLFFTEEVYCRLNKKDYKFTRIYNKLCNQLFDMDYDIYYINLYLGDTSLYKQRLDRPGKAEFKTSKFDIKNSIRQQEVYCELSDEILFNYTNVTVINVDTNDTLQNIQYKLDLLLGIGA